MADDIAVLQNLGLSEPAILEGISVVALFSLITRMADALRFETPNALSTGADLLRRFGYCGMAGPGSLFTSDAGIPRVSEDGEVNRTLPDSMMRWLESVTGLGSAAHAAAPSASRTLVSDVICNPSAVSELDIANLKDHGCTEQSIFDLILSAAASASLVRLQAGYGALHQAPGP
jgi:alkylhydroperoxidase family enzyme